MSLSRSISSSTAFLENMYLIGFFAVTAPFPFETETIVDAAGLADKTGIGLTRDGLTVSKIDIELKIAVQGEVGESTTKIGAGEVKTSVPVGTLRELTVVTGSNSVNEGVCSSVNEVVDTSMDGTRS